MFNIKQMSPAEVLFIRTYIVAMRRQYDLLNTVMDLMDPDNLGIADVAVATRVATELQDMHADFDSALHELPGYSKFARRIPKAEPSMDQLADLFSLSFFKMVTVIKSTLGEKKKDDGWFSGKPDEWQATLKTMQNAPALPDDAYTACLNALAKLFPKFGPDMWPLIDNKSPDVPLKHWPPKPPTYDDTSDTTDDSDDPFDWFPTDD